MSSLPGHGKITRRAVEELALEPRYAGTFGATAAKTVAVSVMARDVLDVVILGHWADFGQCHHFMRRFDGQSEAAAYAEAVEWIRRNAADAARHLAAGARTVAVSARAPVSQSLGNALHALQDSFASGHAEREDPQGARPGAIRRIKRYAGAEKDGHELADQEWHLPGDTGAFSPMGRLAVDATKDLLRVIADSAAASRGGGHTLVGFERFRATWLRASGALSTRRDLAFDLIDRHYTGLRIGAMNLKTINMDEEGLAAALVGEAGTDMRLVLDVFTRLDEHFNSDADDVAERYVNEVRRRGGPLEAALRASPDLVRRLVKVMDEGWTSAGEADCIRWLRLPG